MTPQAGQHYAGKDLEAMSFARNYHRWILDEFSPWLSGHVAEIGAGSGDFSRLLLAAPIERLVAFEPSATMYPLLDAALRHEPRARCVNGYFEPRHLPDPLDAAVYVNVLEHIADDAGELARAHAALKPGGHLLVFVPALSWLYSNFDKEVGHVRRYTRRSLVSCVTGAGFDVVRARYFDIACVLPWYINFVLLGRTMGATGVSLYDRVVVPVMRRIEHVVPPPLGKNILMVARRT